MSTDSSEIGRESDWFFFVWTKWPKPEENGAPEGSAWTLMGRMYSSREDVERRVAERKRLGDTRPHRIVRRDIIMTIESEDPT